MSSDGNMQRSTGAESAETIDGAFLFDREPRRYYETFVRRGQSPHALFVRHRERRGAEPCS